MSAEALPSGSVWLIPFGGKAEKASERSSEAFPFSRRDSNAVTTALGAGAGAPTPNFVWLGPEQQRYTWWLRFLVPRALGKSSPRWFESVGTFPLSREPVTTPPYAGAGAPASGPRACALGEANSQLAAEVHPSKSRKYPKRWL